MLIKHHLFINFIGFFYVFLSEINSVEITENCTIQDSNLTKNGFPPQEFQDFVEFYNVMELHESTGAKCLDGSNYKFYWEAGHGNGSDKFVIFWQAASFCGSEGHYFKDSCLEKSPTRYGSSKELGTNNTRFRMNLPIGYFSHSQEENPLFWNYNKIYALYCDGTLFQGHLDEPMEYNNTKLYIRGRRNTMALLEWARDNLGILDASEVILTGTSGGGLSAMAWIAYLYHNFFTERTRILGIIDASLFMDTYNPRAGCHLYRYFIQNLVNFANMTNSFLYQNCKYGNNPQEVWKCLLPQYMFESINAPLFLMNCEHDYSQLTSLNYITCITSGDGPKNCTNEDKMEITHIRETFLKMIFDSFIPQKNYWGFWLRTCFEHTLAGTWGWYGNITAFNPELGYSLNIKDALTYWYNNGSLRWDNNHARFIDLIDWEHNPLCRI